MTRLGWSPFQRAMILRTINPVWGKIKFKKIGIEVIAMQKPFRKITREKWDAASQFKDSGPAPDPCRVNFEKSPSALTIK